MHCCNISIIWSLFIDFLYFFLESFKIPSATIKIFLVRKAKHVGTAIIKVIGQWCACSTQLFLDNKCLSLFLVNTAVLKPQEITLTIYHNQETDLFKFSTKSGQSALAPVVIVI